MGGGERRVVGLTAVALVLALLLVPGAQARQAKHLFGLNYVFKELTGKDARMLSRSGAKTVRWIMFWPRIEPTSGNFDWSTSDKLVGDLAARGIRVLPIMWGSPRWVEPSTITPPLDTQAARDAWQGFLNAAVMRYGPKGEFWRQSFGKGHAKRKPLPIKTWEIWNEPNLRGAMDPPRPGVYARLLDLSHGAIKGVDRHADVMLGGLLGHSPTGPSARKFLDRVYAQRGAKRDFDEVAIHAYAGSVHDMLGQVRHMRQVMDDHGDKNVPLSIAEIGWGSLPKNPANGGQTQGLQGQKRLLKRSFKALKRKRRRWHIERVLWFNFRDPAGGNPRICAYCTSAGLLSYDYQPKPSWNAFRKFTH
jgi:polysaccharide biosynthesis protein PslG